MNRLAPGVEVTALLRTAEQGGGFGTVLNKGDPDRGSILLCILKRGQHHALLHRVLQGNGGYGWEACGPDAGDQVGVSQYLARRRDSDPDCWIVELDIPTAERFIAETIERG